MNELTVRKWGSDIGSFTGDRLLRLITHRALIFGESAVDNVGGRTNVICAARRGVTLMMNDQAGESDNGKELSFDLEERTAKFGEANIHFCRQVPGDSVTRPLISQVVRSGTSVGANYCEANDAVSRKEFMNKIGTCKEAKESKFWLRMIVKAVPAMRSKALPHWQKAKELLLIFAAIHRKR